MAMQTRRITDAEIEKMKAIHSGKIKPPQWLKDWDAKIEENTRLLAAAISEESLTPEEKDRYIRVVVMMKFRKDSLAEKWFQDIPHKTWDDLAAERPPSHEDLWHYAVEDTEDYLNGPDIQSFALFLNSKWKGFLKDFAHACLRECDPLLEEAIKLTPEVRRVLSYPKEAFDTNDHDVMETRLLNWVGNNLAEGAPGYAHRLVAANVMVATGNEFGAFSQIEFSRCEAAEPKFAEMMKGNDPRSTVYLTQAQHWLIDVLLKLWPA